MIQLVFFSENTLENLVGRSKSRITGEKVWEVKLVAIVVDSLTISDV